MILNKLVGIQLPRSGQENYSPGGEISFGQPDGGLINGPLVDVPLVNPNKEWAVNVVRPLILGLIPGRRFSKWAENWAGNPADICG